MHAAPCVSEIRACHHAPALSRSVRAIELPQLLARNVLVMRMYETAV